MTPQQFVTKRNTPEAREKKHSLGNAPYGKL